MRRPDRYTIGSVTSANAINATVNQRTLAFDFLKNRSRRRPEMSRGPGVLVLDPPVLARTLPDFIA
jgi:hypothetical protein